VAAGGEPLRLEYKKTSPPAVAFLPRALDRVAQQPDKSRSKIEARNTGSHPQCLPGSRLAGLSRLPHRLRYAQLYDLHRLRGSTNRVCSEITEILDLRFALSEQRRELTDYAHKDARADQERYDGDNERSR
jgi:hypothetical protein